MTVPAAEEHLSRANDNFKKRKNAGNRFQSEKSYSTARKYNVIFFLNPITYLNCKRDNSV
jgi:hypothetical protein